MDQISSTSHQGTEKSNMSPEIHCKKECILQSKHSCERPDLTSKKKDQHVNHSSRRQLHRQNAIADNFKPSDENHQHDGATEFNICGDKATEVRSEQMRQKPPSNWRRVEIIQTHLGQGIILMEP